MKRYRLEATLLSPVVIKQDRQSQRSEGTASLSGSALRGALARLYLQEHGQPDERFHKVFLDERCCRFGSLDPTGNTLPATAVSCKRNPGFLADRKPDQDTKDWPHGVADQLWSRIASRLAGQSLCDSPLLPESCQAPRCGHDLKPLSGFWFDTPQGTRKASKGNRRLDMHIGIDRATHTAAEKILYTLDALDPVVCSPDDLHPGEKKPQLVGWFDASDEVLGVLDGLLKSCGQEVRIGHARTRGYGRVQLQVVEAPPASRKDWGLWSKALHDFLGQVRKELKRAGLPGHLQPDRHFFFTLSLPEGALLVDPLLRASLDLAGMTGWLPALPPPEPRLCVLDLTGKDAPEGGKLWCVAAVAHHERARGWNAAHGLPRQDEWAVNRGAVYAYLFEGDESARLALVERLGQLEREGIGARRNEGFGRVVVSEDFHRRFHIQEKQGGKR